MHPLAFIGELPVQEAAPVRVGVPKLVIFDCDGVLVQSEEITLSVLISLLNEQARRDAPEAKGLDSVEFIERFRGRKIADCLSEAEQRFNICLDSQFEQTFRQTARLDLTAKLKPTDGILEVLEGLTLPFCVASSAPLNKIEHCLRLTELWSYFEGHLFSCYELGRWKPDPLVFLTACAAYNVDPCDAWVIEDSIAGIHAAVAANISVLGFGPVDRHSMLADAGALPFSDMRELRTLLA
ncbi:HAD family phosphatase [Pseudomonas sp. FP2338]|uniref:HAD family hydrolase n=1 Tax=Pseudomonas sp. FP2338 TaxID=2954093 RepID=UPI002732F23B|nr:HAD-IA family hydrolase [Pseudomonas sp. FP2338]WLH86789.1 HAD-IA family hydrolase [Pseudomonas sp. FP2338]